MKRIGETTSADGHSYSQQIPTAEEPYWYHSYRSSGGDLQSELIVTEPEGSRELYVGVHKDLGFAVECVQPWIEAVQYALSHIDDSLPNFGWTALIGPVGNQIRGVQYVEQGATLGHLDIEPATTPAMEYVAHPRIATLTSRQGAASYPLLVRGTHKAYDWPNAQRLASTELQAACAMLTVALNVNWQVREMPQPSTWGDIRVPARSAWGPSAPLDGTEFQRQSVVIPDWCSEAWSRSFSDSGLLQAFHSHHQGVTLEAIAPSHALLAFVGAVEGIGKKLRNLRRCECCDRCSVKVGATQRFRAALALVFEPREIKRLEKIAYGNRSLVVHEGALLGGETSGHGVSVMDVFTPRDGSSDFVHQIVWRMKEASRRVMIHAAQHWGELPEDAE
jgi:hypothetical protein